MYLHNIDLHYHAGQERDAGTTIGDYLEHAVLSGRRVLGVTDHYGLFQEPRRPDKQYLYEATQAGLCAYHDEVMTCSADYPSLAIRFAPELSPRVALDEIPDAVLGMSDYFICETSFPAGTVAENTASSVQRIEQLGRWSASTGVPAFIAHPFRSSVNYRLVKRTIEAWVTQLAPRPDGDFSADELSRFFLLDVKELGAASAAFGVPLEVNGNTHYRLLCSNLPATMEMFYSAYRLLGAQGATFVPGSDQHSFRRSVGRVGSYVPVDVFRAMGVGIADLPFLARIGVEPGDGEAKEEERGDMSPR